MPRATNAVLHPWLQEELEAILADAAPPDPTARPRGRRRPGTWRERALWDRTTCRRSGCSWSGTIWPGTRRRRCCTGCWSTGVWPLYTPLGGSWLNLAESVQRILVRRALDGQHPQTAREVMAWLAAAVAGWNADPTPFVWGGKRAARRQRARERRHALGGSGGYTRRPIPRTRRPRYELPLPNAYVHVT